MRRYVLVLLSSLFISACASHPKTSEVVEDSETSVSKTEVSSSVIEHNAEQSYHSEYGEVNLKQNSMVEKWIGYFQGKGRRWMDLYLSRSTRYMPMMKNTLREYGLPEDLVFVSMIESGFSPMARSRAAAVGYWQFIKPTAKTYGLTVNQYIDERRDPVLSTRAAAEYFKALYTLFGSWHLALASYNSGENRVKSVVMKTFTRDFWELVRLRKIPPETQNYVPKFIAAALIAKDPAKYGFNEISFEPALNYDTVNLKHGISLKKLATALNIDDEELKLLNPKYRSDYVPTAPRGDTVFRVPSGKKDQALASLESANMETPKIIAGDDETYRIRSGDSLSTIAHKHGTSVHTLLKLNHFNGHQLLRVGSSIRVPERFVAEETVTSRKPTQADGSHVVRRGENLSTIARMYNLTLDELKRLNKLSRRSTIRTGDRLIIRGASEKVEIKNAESRSLVRIKTNPHLHVVRRGETLRHIAKKYNIPLARLLALNDLQSRSSVGIGSSIRISK